RDHRDIHSFPTRRSSDLLNWNERRALALPNFLRSTERGSRRRRPSFFRIGRYSGLTSQRTRAIAILMASAWPLGPPPCTLTVTSDRKSTRLNSSHVAISY